MSFSRKSDCDFFWDQKLIYAICVLKWLVNVIWRTFVGFWRVLVQVIVFYCWRLGYRVSSAFFKVVNEKVWSPLLRIFQVAFYAKLEKGFQRSQIWCFCHRRLRSLLFLSWIMLTTFGIFLICNACECFSKSVDMVAWVLVLSGGGVFFQPMATRCRWTVCCHVLWSVKLLGNGFFGVGIRPLRNSGRLFCGALCPVTLSWACVHRSYLGLKAGSLPS